MKKIEFNTNLNVYSNVSELSMEDQKLIAIAEEQLPIAYAPYSKFHVAAALSLANGEIVTGVNQENASYPLCICGERVALYNAGANFPDAAPVTLAIIAKNQLKETTQPVTPCGACRQVICEYELRHDCKIRILLKGGDGKEIYECNSGKDLLPFFFDSSFL